MGEHQLHIKHGETEFQTEKFQINRDKETLIKVELLPREIRVFANGSTPLGQQRLSDSKLQSELFDRQVLEWVQSKTRNRYDSVQRPPHADHGASNQKSLRHTPVDTTELPKDDFLIESIEFVEPAFWRKAS